MHWHVCDGTGIMGGGWRGGVGGMGGGYGGSRRGDGGVCVVGEKLLPVGGGRSHRPEVPVVEDKYLQPPKEDKRKEKNKNFESRK